MIRVNLLPHREQARKERRQQFYSLLVLVALLAGLVWFLVHSIVMNRIERQERSNLFLNQEITKLESEIAEIKQLREQTQALLSRKKIIESLQANRNETVILFNELVKQMPEGVMLKGIKQTGLNVNFTGYSQSNARVSQLMRNLEASSILEKPAQSSGLVEIKSTTFNKRTVGEFNLDMVIERAPAVEQSGGGVSSQQSAGGAKK